MERARHVVAYDIREPKRLRRVHRVMKGFGFKLQYSVFLCDLTAAERFDLLTELMEVIDEAVDCIAIVELGSPRDHRSFTFLGPSPDLNPWRTRVF